MDALILVANLPECYILGERKSQVLKTGQLDGTQHVQPAHPATGHCHKRISYGFYTYNKNRGKTATMNL